MHLISVSTVCGKRRPEADQDSPGFQVASKPALKRAVTSTVKVDASPIATRVIPSNQRPFS